MTINRARAFADAWLRAMRIYAGALTRAMNEDNANDSTYFVSRYNRAHARWCEAVARVGDMNVAAAQAAAKRRSRSTEGP